MSKKPNNIWVFSNVNIFILTIVGFPFFFFRAESQSNAEESVSISALLCVSARGLEGAVAHATRGRDGRQEGRECGYYYLHRNLNDSLFHDSSLFTLHSSLP